MEAIFPSETSGCLRTTRKYYSEYRTLKVLSVAFITRITKEAIQWSLDEEQSSLSHETTFLLSLCSSQNTCEGWR
jgi:hypothetical protein